MILSRLVLHPLSREVSRAVRDVHRMHRLVMTGFPASDRPDGRARHGVLHRLEVDRMSGGLVLHVQSRDEPDWTGLPDGTLASLEGGTNPAVRPLSELGAVRRGQVLRFRLRANATRRIETRSVDGRRRHGRRVPHRDDTKLLDWLIRQSNASGFELVAGPVGPEVVLVKEGVQRGRRDGRVLTFEGVLYEGVLRVSDEGDFRAAVARGIGPGKAYGFGLLSFSPA